MTLSIPKGERNREYKVNLKEVFEDVYSTTCTLGDGIVNISAVISVLREISYDGYISIEHEPEYYELMEEVKKSLARLHQWLRK